MNGGVWSTKECGKLETTPPHQNASPALAELIINNGKNSARYISMERPYGKVCEHVRRGVPMAHQYLSISFVSLPSHWKVGKNKASFLRPSHLDRLDLSASHHISYGGLRPGP